MDRIITLKEILTVEFKSDIKKYVDTDSRPMYISYSAYLSKEQAKKEAGRNIGGEKKYIDALTSYQYIQEYLKESI